MALDRFVSGRDDIALASDGWAMPQHVLDAIAERNRRRDEQASARGFCPTGSGGGVDNSCGPGGGASKLPAGQVYSSKYGMDYSSKNAKVVEKARGVPDEKWNELPVTSIPHGTTLKANEEVLKTAPIEKVVSGKEPFREGYVTKLWRDGKGNLHVVDGHHRVAMYHALGKDMPARIMGQAEYEKLMGRRSARGFCPTGEGGGVDNSCGSGKGGGSGAGGKKSAKSCPPPCHRVDPLRDDNGDGVTDAARVGVPAMEVPPPPAIGRVPNLDERSRAVEDAFISHFEKDPEKVASQFREIVLAQGGTPTFGTDDAKCLTDAWSHPDPEVRAENRATLNTALHQTANAIAKRAFLQHLDTMSEGDEIMVTVGGCGAGKGFALKNVPAALEMKNGAKVVWDSAGDQNATENPWILKEAEARGLKVNFVYVHADPRTQWADPDRGVVKRASDPKDGRMVDAKVFADSYAIGARNHNAFHQANKDNPSARFVFLDNTGKPKQISGVPQSALGLDPDELADFAEKAVERSAAPARVKTGALQGREIWPKRKAGK